MLIPYNSCEKLDVVRQEITDFVLLEETNHSGVMGGILLF
jgi:hypothetical protein